jgi:hypothetical protein
MTDFNMFQTFSAAIRVPEGIRGNNFAQKGNFFVCYQLSFFLSTPGGHAVGISGELCRAIIFITLFLNCAVKNINAAVPFHV